MAARSRCDLFSEVESTPIPKEAGKLWAEARWRSRVALSVEMRRCFFSSDNNLLHWDYHKGGSDPVAFTVEEVILEMAILKPHAHALLPKSDISHALILITPSKLILFPARRRNLGQENEEYELLNEGGKSVDSPGHLGCVSCSPLGRCFVAGDSSMYELVYHSEDGTWEGCLFLLKTLDPSPGGGWLWDVTSKMVRSVGQLINPSQRAPIVQMELQQKNVLIARTEDHSLVPFYVNDAVQPAYGTPWPWNQSFFCREGSTVSLSSRGTPLDAYTTKRGEIVRMHTLNGQNEHRSSLLVVLKSGHEAYFNLDESSPSLRYMKTDNWRFHSMEARGPKAAGTQEFVKLTGSICTCDGTLLSVAACKNSETIYGLTIGPSVVGKVVCMGSQPETLSCLERGVTVSWNTYLDSVTEQLFLPSPKLVVVTQDKCSLVTQLRPVELLQKALMLPSQERREKEVNDLLSGSSDQDKLSLMMVLINGRFREGQRAETWIIEKNMATTKTLEGHFHRIRRPFWEAEILQQEGCGKPGMWMVAFSEKTCDDLGVALVTLERVAEWNSKNSQRAGGKGEELVLKIKRAKEFVRHLLPLASYGSLRLPMVDSWCWSEFTMKLHVEEMADDRILDNLRQAYLHVKAINKRGVRF